MEDDDDDFETSLARASLSVDQIQQRYIQYVCVNYLSMVAYTELLFCYGGFM